MKEGIRRLVRERPARHWQPRSDSPLAPLAGSYRLSHAASGEEGRALTRRHVRERV